MKNFKKEEKMTKCIICLKDIEKDTSKKCPNCGNTFGLSSNDTLKVTSIGDMTFKERIDEDFFVFTFDFDFDLKSHHNDILYKKLKDSYTPFLGVEVHAKLNSNVGFAQVSAVAVFNYAKYNNNENGFIEIDVELPKDVIRDLKSAMTPFMIESLSEEYNLCDCDHSCTWDDECDCNCDCNCNSDFEDIFGLEDDCGFDFLDQNSDNILKLKEIADAMYNAVKSDSFVITDSKWNKLDDFVKYHMASLLQKDKEDLDELMIYNDLGDTSKCSDELKSKITYILEKCYRISELALSEVKSLIDFINNEDEEYIHEEDDDFCDEYEYEDEDDDYEDEYDEDFYDEAFDALYEALESMGINYTFYYAIEASDPDVTAQLITILDNNDNEVLYIAITNDDKYHVFKSVEEKDGYKIFNADDSTSIILNLEELTSILEKMNLDNNRFSNNKYSNKFIENIASLDFEILETAPEFMIKEFILKNIDKLSNEELINELNNRLSSK